MSYTNITCDNCKHRRKLKTEEPCVDCSQAYSLKFEYDKYQHLSIYEIISDIAKDIKLEEKMTDKRVIFESEEEAYKLLQKTTGRWEDDLKMLKQAGYIRKNPVEEAEEMILLSGSYADGLDVSERLKLLREIISKCDEAIQYLKERLK